MGFFSKARDMYSLQKQAKSVKKELKNIHIEAEVDGVTVVISGDNEVISVTVSDAALAMGKKKIEELFLKASNKAMKKVQEIAGAKMKGVWELLKG